MKPTTIASLQKCKQEKKRFATITAYDYSFAKLFAEEGLNVMLVGDSLGCYSAMSAAAVGRTSRSISCPSRMKTSVGHNLTRKERPSGRPLPSSILR